MEVSILHGATVAVQRFADAIRAETGVRHGALNAVPVEVDVTGNHPHADDAPGHPHAHPHPHIHSSPKT
jgi:CopG family nickel-responsive transcriptional regulator